MTTAIPNKDLAGQKIIIVGGGIGGASGALALALRGAEVELYEQHFEFKEVGAGLQIGPHGVKMLERWGLKEKAIAGGYLPDNMVFKDAVTAETILDMDFGEQFRERYGAPYLVIHRSDLLNLLLAEAEKHGAKLMTGYFATGAEKDGEGVTLTLKNLNDGEKLVEVRGDVLIGFDGTHSIFRQEIVQDSPVPSAYVAYRGTSNMENETEDAKKINSVVGYIGPRCHFIQYPLRQGEMLNQVAVFQSPRYLDALVDGTEVPEDWGNNDEFKDAFSHTNEYVQSRLGNMWLNNWWQMADREPLEDWVVNDRIIVMGDAAHPPLQYIASGAIMAMEDSEVFAVFASEAAAKGELNWGTVLREVSDERAPRCNRIQTTSRFWGEMWHVDGVARHVRNEAFRQAERTGWYRYADWLWDYDPSARAYIENPELGQLPPALRDWEYLLHKIDRQREEGKEGAEITL